MPSDRAETNRVVEAAPPPAASAPVRSTDPGGPERFAFGDNWEAFLEVVGPERVAAAERGLRDLLGTPVEGCSFLDAGSGSGLSSLAALRLGAGRVHSFDLDPASVRATGELRRCWGAGAGDWTVERGDVLDTGYLASLGRYDVVHSWGVLHHTGRMWDALENVSTAVAPGGLLAVALYNDQGGMSRVWRVVKRTYNRLPRPLRTPYAVAVMAPRELKFALLAKLARRLGTRVRGYTRHRDRRGMSRWHDLLDWVGGYPFETAAPDAVFGFLHRRGFALTGLVTRQGIGCNEFVFRRDGGG